MMSIIKTNGSAFFKIWGGEGVGGGGGVGVGEVGGGGRYIITKTVAPDLRAFLLGVGHD